MKNTTHDEEDILSFGKGPGDLVVAVDPDGRFLYVNTAYCELFGRSIRELVGEWFMPLVHEEDRRHTEEEMRKLWNPPYSCYIKQRAMTVRGWRWIAWYDHAVLNKEGVITEILGFGRDITESM